MGLHAGRVHRAEAVVGMSRCLKYGLPGVFVAFAVACAALAVACVAVAYVALAVTHSTPALASRAVIYGATALSALVFARELAREAGVIA